MLSRLLFVLALLVAAPALGQGWPTTKPPPLGAPGGAAPMMPAPAPMPGPVPAPGQAQGTAPGRCAAPLAAGCQRMQGACQVACPGIWSSNPNAPAFTPTDRAGCMQRCFHQYLACQRQYGC